MRKPVVTLSLGLLLMSTSLASAQWAVHDAPAFARDAAQWVEEAAQWAESLANQAKEIQGTYNVILRQIEQLKWMAENMQRMPQGLNMLDYIMAINGKITGVMSQARLLSYNLDQSATQFDALYAKSALLMQGPALAAQRQRLLDARRESSLLSVQMAAIQTNLSDAATRMSALLSGSDTAQGAMENAQIAAQQQALMHHTLQTVAAMLATNNRVAAQTQAEEVKVKELQIQALEQGLTPLPAYQGGNTQPWRFSW